METVVILANGLATRMGGSAAKTLTPVRGDQTILEVLLKEIGECAGRYRVVLFVREERSELRRISRASGLNVELHIAEPRGYFRDLVAVKRDLGLRSFAVVDSDLVVPTGQLTSFLDASAADGSWLTIGVTKVPERSSGRPAWVRLDDADYISHMDRLGPAEHRTVGAFRWSDLALRDAGTPTSAASVMAYISQHLDTPARVRGVHFDDAVNVNTESDIDAACRVLAATAAGDKEESG